MPQSKTEFVKQSILNAIRSGEYPPGSTLPPVKTLSKLCNVSKHTVSQALSNLHELHILDVSHGRKTRVRKQEKRIRLLYFGRGTPELFPFWKPFCDGISAELERHPEFQLSVETLSAASLDSFRRAPDCHGMILMGSDFGELNSLLLWGIPAVSVYDFHDRTPVSCISSDFETPVRELAVRLRERDCRTVAIFNQFEKENTQGVNLRKLRIFHEILRGSGFRVRDCFWKLNGCLLTGGYEMLLKLRESPPDAVILGTDDMAPGVYRAARELGLEIPADLCVCGCNDLPIARFLFPPLSSIALDAEQQGALACRHLIEHPDDPPLRLLLPARLIRRGSI